MEIGDKVAYIKYDGSHENGIVKSFGKDDIVFVVYNCAGEWEHYQDYTAASTDIRYIVMGWRK